jgi:acylphosphatase
MKSIRRRVTVSGEVQGVFFRDTCRREALTAGVTGWVRNLPGGEVEAVFEGEPGAVDGLIAWAARGPRQATVDRVEVVEEEPEGTTGFEIRASPR